MFSNELGDFLVVGYVDLKYIGDMGVIRSKIEFVFMSLNVFGDLT